MSSAGEVLSVVKKIFLVSEELTRLAADVKELSHIVHDHEGRLIRLETTLAVTARPPRLVLPGE